VSPEPGDRRPAVLQRAHGQVLPGQGLRQARRQLRNQFDRVLAGDPAPRLAGPGLATGTVPLADTSAGLPA